MELYSKSTILLGLFSICSGINSEDDLKTSNRSSRNGKQLFGNANMEAIQEIHRHRLDKLELEVMMGNMRTKAKLDNLRIKVKNLNKELEFLKNIDVTQLQNAIATINTFQNTISTLESSVATLEESSTAQQASITALESISTSQQASISALETSSTAQQTSIAALESTNTAQQTDIDSVKTSVTSLNANNTAQQTEMAAVETKVASVETKVTTIESMVTTNTEKVTKVNNCFADINSADCPSAKKRRNGRNLDTDLEEYDNDDLGPHPSVILKNIFRSNLKRKKLRQTTTALIPAIKIFMACMNDNTAAACTAEYRSVVDSIK